MYLAAFPKIAAEFNTTTARIALSLSSYFVGLAFGQIFYGPFLDRFGRKKPIYFGLSLYIVASITCAYAKTADQLIVIRFFQALGGCAASVGSMAMVRDFFTPQEGAKVFSRLMLILSVSPLFAPTIGGWVSTQWNWQAVFFILAGIVFMILMTVAFLLPPPQKPDPTVSLKPKNIIATFIKVLHEKQFLLFTISGAFSFASLFAYLAGAPSIFMGMFGLSENQFGLVFAGLSIGMIGGGQLNILLTRWFSGYKIFRTMITIQVFVGTLILVCSVFDLFNMYTQIAALFCYISCIGLTYPNAASLALAPFKKNVGSASSLLGSLQMTISAIASALFGVIPFSANVSLGMVFVGTAIIGCSFFWIFNIPEEKLSTH